METTKTLQITAKTVQPKTYLCHTQKTTLSKMMETAGELVDALYEEIWQQKLEKDGVIEFIYLDCNGKPNDPFILKIAMPVKAGATISSDRFKLEETAEFKCVSHIYKGDVSQIGCVYEGLFGEVLAHGHKPTNQVREVYEKFVSLDSPENSTEIQIGIM